MHHQLAPPYGTLYGNLILPYSYSANTAHLPFFGAYLVFHSGPFLHIPLTVGKKYRFFFVGKILVRIRGKYRILHTNL